MTKTRSAIVTGATGGLGKEFVRLLINDDRFDEIFVLSRNGENLENLKSEFGDKIRPYIIDLSDVEQIKNFGKFIETQNVQIGLLINNAGYGKFCSYDDISLDESINMIDLNISGVVATGLTCIPYMDKGSHIINIASQAGFQPVPYQNIYSATKSFVKNYSLALNQELKEKGIKVTAVCPGWVKTDFFKRACIGAKKASNKFTCMTTPEIVAKKALKDAYRGKDLSVCGFYPNFCRIMVKLLPEKWIMKYWLWSQGLI